MQSIEIKATARVTPSNKPQDKVALRIGNGIVTYPALDVVKALLGLSGNGHNAELSVAAPAVDHMRIAIGAKGAHGVYAGIARADATMGDHVIEVLDGEQEKISWADALKWAESIGGTLPTRKEQALLFANVPELFKPEWYWSCEEHASESSYAWCQGFDVGNQNDGHKGISLRARAVRRLVIS